MGISQCLSLDLLRCLEATDLKRLRELEEENRRLKQMYAELSLDHRVLKDIVERKL